MCAPVMLVAQNGVTVSGLAVNAGTVTFNVSWKTPMPVEPWLDSAWVFVDYNKNGVMTRLPVADATVSAGSAIKIPGNDKGVWVVGNARSVGSFSATVKLLTTIADFPGACAYASNYPPVGEYISDTEISFTGTPMYEISLAHPDAGSATVKSGDTFLLPCDYTLTSFTDATGVPGIIKCIPMIGDIDFTVPAVSKNQQASFVVNSTIVTTNPALITYSWSALDFSPVTHEGATFTSTAPATPGTYSVTLTAYREDYCDLVKTKDVEVQDCHAPGAMGITFAAFNPCAGASYGATYTLTDDRDQKTYKVKYMSDGRYWMVQDLSFGNRCTNNASMAAYTADRTDIVNDSGNYYGACTDIRNGSTPKCRGYFYNWAAAVNYSGAFNGGEYYGCDATNPNSCQGICPRSWHLPTKSDWDALFAKMEYYNCDVGTCDVGQFELSIAGFLWSPSNIAYQNCVGLYWSSTRTGANNAAQFDGYGTGGHGDIHLGDGNRVRCIRNY